MAELRHDKWAGTTYGNGWMHRWLIRFLKAADVRLLYAFVFMFVIPPTMIVNFKARNAIYGFYRKGMNLGKARAAWMTYKNHCAFSQVVIDRFAMYAGKKFRIKVEGYEIFKGLCEDPEGFIQLSSHIGNYEIAGYSLPTEEKRFNALVFGGEKESVMTNRNRLFEGNNIRMIAMQPDMSHLFEINKVLADGEILSMPADRIFGSQKNFRIPFLGSDAKFPQGPFLLAAVRDVPMLFVSVMKTGAKEYTAKVKRIGKNADKSGKQRAEELAREYVAMLEESVNEHPAQWYNYFDFWRD